jgi:hypothetical protein
MSGTRGTVRLCDVGETGRDHFRGACPDGSEITPRAVLVNALRTEYNRRTSRRASEVGVLDSHGAHFRAKRRRVSTVPRLTFAELSVVFREQAIRIQNHCSSQSSTCAAERAKQTNLYAHTGVGRRYPRRGAASRPHICGYVVG